MVIDQENLHQQSFAGIAAERFVVIKSTLVDCSFEDMNVAQISFGSGGAKSLYKGKKRDTHI